MKKSDFRYENDFRSKTKCPFDDSGFCKYGDKCRKVHYRSICSRKDCDKLCKSRHPKSCKFKENCRFLAKKVCAFQHKFSVNENKELNDLKRQVDSLKQENENKQLKLMELDKDLKTLKANQESKEENNTVKELKLVVTALIKDVQAKEKKLLEMEKETHHLKLQVESINTKLMQDENFDCEKCEFVAKSKRDLSNHIGTTHGVNSESELK
jgi:hypothetical protein